MGWLGNTGRRIGRFCAGVWHNLVKLWHRISPIANALVKEFLRTVGEEGYDIIKETVTEIDLSISDLADTTKRRKAFRKIIQKFNEADILAADRWINFGIEFVVNALREGLEDY